MDWKDYQEDAAALFRSLGLEAETDVSVQGVRTKHDVDVLVKSRYAGFDITWIVECKHWNSRVSKLHVLALREIVTDTGADRGILLAENGFQDGAREAAALTNVHATSLAEIAVTASRDIHAMQLRDLYDRLTRCRSQYWEIPKSDRIEHGLRPEVGAVGYSGDWAAKAAEDLIAKGFRGTYPVSPDEVHAMISRGVLGQQLPRQINTSSELVNVVALLVESLEKRIESYMSGLR